MHDLSLASRMFILAWIGICTHQISQTVAGAPIEKDAADAVLQQVRERLFGPGIIHAHFQFHNTISSNDASVVRSRVFDLHWKWPDSIAFQLQEHAGPGSPPRLSSIHIDPGVLHLVNEDASAYLSEEYDGLAATNANHLQWMDPGFHEALFLVRLLSGDIPLDLEQQLVEYRFDETRRDDRHVHLVRLSVPFGEHSVRSPHANLPLLISIWFEEDTEHDTIGPAAMHMSAPPEMSEPFRVGYRVGVTHRVLLWESTSILDPGEKDLVFSPPEDAKQAATPHELLGLPDEEEIEGEPRDLIGKPAPSFELSTLEGARVSLPIDRDNAPITILDFWATWCGPCIRAMPDLIAIADEFRDHNVLLYAVNLGEPRDTVTEFIERRDWTLNVLLDENQDVVPKYKAVAIPQTVILDRNGIVRHVHIGFDDDLKEMIRSVVQSLLEEEK